MFLKTIFYSKNKENIENKEHSFFFLKNTKNIETIRFFYEFSVLCSLSEKKRKPNVF